jgi:fructuronate reductase
MRWQGGVDDAGAGFAVDDPLADRTAAALAGCNSAAERVGALLALDAVFPAALAADAAFRDALVDWLA